MSILKINNLFSNSELENIKQIIDSSREDVNDSILGRAFVLEINLPDNIKEKITKICSEFLNVNLCFTNASFAEYSNLYGNPNLPPHFDGDINALVVDYQLESNTSWDLGIDLKSYPLQDNSALIFDTNKYIHWRPHKNFEDGEYVKMLFFRVHDPKNIVDNSHLNYQQNDKIFEEVRKFRDSLS
jgi:hypothetical protein